MKQQETTCQDCGRHRPINTFCGCPGGQARARAWEGTMRRVFGGPDPNDPPPDPGRHVEAGQ